jgi:methylated-DNA-[protein]-cysteine S-methyltransferase
MSTTVAYWSAVGTPVGQVFVAGEEDVVYRVAFGGPERAFTGDLERQGFHPKKDAARITPALAAFNEYFTRGAAIQGIHPAPAEGTAFQQEVWRALGSIPHGEVRSYRWLAEAVGRPNAFRAVGAANGANPIPILVPCHRVVKADGRLGGYSAGLSIKEKLLEIEGLDVDRRGYVSPRSTSTP